MISAFTYILQHHPSNAIDTYIKKETIQFLNTKSSHSYNNYISYLYYLRQNLNWNLKSEDNEILRHIAKTTTTNQQSIPNILLPTTVIGFYIKNKEITEQLHNIISKERHHHPIQEYLTNKYHWSNSTFSSIDWQLH
jgi:hypothetical protein